MNDRLYRSLDDRVIAGVCGGLADRLNLDPALVRIAFVVLALVTAGFPFVILYVVMAIVVPEQPTWSGVRPVGSAWGDGWSASQPPGTPPRPDAVPGWVPPGYGPQPPGWAQPDASNAGPFAASPGTPGATRAPDAQGTPAPGTPDSSWAGPGWAGSGAGAGPGAGAGSPGSGWADSGWAGSGVAGPGVAGTDAAWDRLSARDARRAARDARRAARRDDPTFGILAGIFLVGLGAFFLLRNAFGFDWELIWPAIIVTLGLLIVIAGLRPRRRDG